MTSHHSVGMKELIRLERYVVKTGNKFFIFESINSFIENNIMSGLAVQDCADSISRRINCFRMETAYSEPMEFPYKLLKNICHCSTCHLTSLSASSRV